VRALAWAALLALGCDARLPIGALATGPPDDAAAPRPDVAQVIRPDAAAPRSEDAFVPPEDAFVPALPPDAATCATGPPRLDIIILIDNSSSMEARMLTLLRRLSSDLPRVMTAAGVDYRVVLVSRYGAYGTHLGDTYSPVCISAPLSDADCTAAARTPLINHPPTFFHFSAYVDSVNGLCRLLEVWDRPDELPSGERTWTALFPTGLSAALRPEAWKALLVISDDEAGCRQGTFQITEGEDPATAAHRFVLALTTLSPQQFGGAARPRVTVFSLVGASAGAGQLLPPSAPIAKMCSDADKAGVLYQGLSIATGGARQSICDLTTVDPLFEAMASVAATECP
jgi:hypothetical protein